jgi:UDP-2,4-diacetamido-2,4,6-trideoxy-beta-L-altropyranose hydrolase
VGARSIRRVLFAVAAGPRTGFGHLIRARSLARALGVEFTVALRGSIATRRRAVALGARIVDVGGVVTLRDGDPDVLIVDDPIRAEVARWVRRARRAGVPVATVHDLGISAVASDLVIDGTVAPNRRIRGRVDTVHGPAYMILDPSIFHSESDPTHTGSDPGLGSDGAARRVLVALGGGSSAAGAQRIADAIEDAVPGVVVCVARGFAGRRRGPDGLAGELARATVAVVAGGVTLYETCALGVPAVAVPLSPRQQITVRAIAQHGAAIDAGRVPSGSSRRPPASRNRRQRATRKGVASGFSRKIGQHVARLLADAAARKRMSRAGRRLVDGRGAFRVAAAVRRLARTRVPHVA